MSTRVLLLRHAESADPTVFHGAESDVGLSERGQRQAEAIAPLLAAEEPDAVISSGMLRARETALPIARACGLPLRIEPALHERRVGALSGTAFQAKEGVWPDTLRRWMTGDIAYAPPGAESFADIRARVLPAWERLASEHAGRTVVVVAHGVVVKVLLLTLLEGYSVSDWARLGSIQNVALNDLILDADGWRAERLNELPAELKRL